MPVFLSLTTGMTAEQRAQTAVWATLIAAGILIGSSLFGQTLLQLLGISLAAFRNAGGLMLFYIAFEMVFKDRSTERSQRAKAKVAPDNHRNLRQLAVFPLAIPLLAGPGAMTACILLASRDDTGPLHMAILIAMIVITCYLALLAFRTANTLNKLLGETGKIVLTRVLGVLLAALAVQFVIDGVLEIAKVIFLSNI